MAIVSDPPDVVPDIIQVLPVEVKVPELAMAVPLVWVLSCGPAPVVSVSVLVIVTVLKKVHWPARVVFFEEPPAVKANNLLLVRVALQVKVVAVWLVKVPAVIFIVPALVAALLITLLH